MAICMDKVESYGKEIRAELNQITWPNKKDLCKKTLIVLGMSAALTAVVGAAEFVSSLAFQLLIRMGV